MKMFGAFVFASIVATVFGAALMPGQQPQKESLENRYQEYERYLRDRRSSYPNSYYAPAPCAAPAPIPALAPAYHIGPLHHAPSYAPAISPYGLGLGLPQYRGADENEMMGFSDMDPMQEQAMSQQAMFEQAPFGHMPSARYAYGPGSAAIAPAYGIPSAAAAAYSINAAPQAAAPAIGVFPNANLGGCSVPLLLSCSPSISSGHILKSHSGGYSHGGEAYRGVDELQQNHDAHEEAMHDLAPAHDAAQTSAPLHQ